MKSASLNHVYRVVWSHAAQAYIAVSEHTHARGKRGGLMGALAALGLLGASLAHAANLPTGGTIVGGVGSISQSGNNMVVNQSSNKLVTNWNSFDVGRDASVTFQQPDSASIALNRVIGGGNASQILGKLNANGQVWILNPNGVVIGKGAQVNVGGLVASSLKISDQDFLAGKTTLSGGAGAGAVSNEGNITTGQGGVVALIGPQVSNSGTIRTPGGSTVLAAGDKVTLDFAGDGLVGVNVDRGVLDALVRNSGHISADGGLVTLSARSADAAISSVVNNTGIIEAKGMVERNGRILLDGDDQGGMTQVAGILDVSSEQGEGGDIVITGEQIALSGATLEASGAQGGGTVKVGGGWQGKDASVVNAHKVTADAHTSVRADATERGDGGTVVLWSDDSNRFAGNISVRGGAQSGNGGKAEVSGKQTLQYTGVTDARASHGRTGDLLLDPANITVSGGSGSSGDWSTGSGNVTVYEETLEAQTANVLLQATNLINFSDLNQNGGDGTISMQENVSFRAEVVNSNSGTRTMMTFENSDNTLEVSGTGSIYLQAGGGGTGTIGESNGSGLTGAKGLFNLVAHGNGDNPEVADIPAHVVDQIGNGTPGAGTITVLGADGATLAGKLETNGGYVRISVDSDAGVNAGGAGNLVINKGADITTNDGNLYLSFGGDDYSAKLFSDITLGQGRLYFGDAIPGGITKQLGSSTGEKQLGGLLSLSGDVNFTTPLTMLGGASIYTDGDINFSSNVKLDTGDDALTLRAANIDFTQATLLNVSTASLRLEPWDIATNISLDGTDGIATADTLTKLDNIMNLTIGREDGTGLTTVNSGGFDFNANNSLTLLNGDMQINGALQNTNATGHVIARAGQHDVVIGVGGSVTGKGTGDAVVLSAARNFLNHAGSTALNATNNNGRWLTYSSSPESDIRGGLSLDFKQYNAGYGDTLAQLTGDGQIYRVAPKVTVGLTGEVNKTYDGNAHATVTDDNFSTATGSIDGDDISLIISGFDTASYDNKNAGSGKTVTVEGVELGVAQNGDTKVYGYQLDSTTVTGDIGNIDKKVLTATADVADKIYDGSTGADLSGIQLVGVVTGDADDLMIVGDQGSFSDKNAGADKSVSGSGISLSGDESGNYSFDTGAEIGTADISKKTLTATADVADKVYDGSTGADLSGIQLVGVVSGDADDLTIVGDQGSFSDKNAGADKSVSGSGISLSGDEAGNYSFDTGAEIGTADISKKTLTATADVADKVYDGSTGADLSGIQLVGVVSGDADDLTIVGDQGSFSDKNAGADKSVSGSGISLSGDEAGNYSFDTGAEIGTADISKKTLTATADVADKVYDGNTGADLSDIRLVGVVSGDADDLTIVGDQGSFSDKNASADKSVSGSGISLSGDESGNYSFDTGAEIGTADISKKTLTATADVADKVYDGSTGADLSGIQLVGVVSGDADDLTIVGDQGSFSDKNAGTDKSVSGSGISLSGDESGNYSFDTGAEIGQADIDKKNLTAVVDVADKPYDGKTTATIRDITLVGAINGDNIGASGSAQFLTPEAGSDKTVTGVDLQLIGDDSANYQLQTTQFTSTASINAPSYVPVGLIGKVEGANGTALTVNRPETGSRTDALLYTQPIASSALMVGDSSTKPGTTGTVGNGPLRGDILSANGRLSLALGDGETKPASKNILALYSTHIGEDLKDEGRYSASDMGSSIILEKEASALGNLPMLQHKGTAGSEGVVTLSTGELLQLNVSMLKNATLLVEVDPVGHELSNEELATYGLAVAKQRLGVSVESLKAIVIEHSLRQASIAKMQTFSVVNR